MLAELIEDIDKALAEVDELLVAETNFIKIAIWEQRKLSLDWEKILAEDFESKTNKLFCVSCRAEIADGR